MVPANSPTQYATDVNLAARQRLWTVSRSEPALDLHGWLLDLALLRGGERVVEVGCGNGWYLQRVPGAVGLDLSPGMLRSARHRTPGPLVCGDAQSLPFASGALDVALAPHMLYHVPDRERAAHELRRVVRPGGLCVAATNSEHTYAELHALIAGIAGNAWTPGVAARSAFSLENGAEQLRVAFDDVRRVDAPRRVVHVTDADALADYVASIGDLYAGLSPAPWAEVVEGCRQRAAATIEHDGELVITSVMGAFVCR